MSESFDVDSVPSFVLLRGHTLLSRISGANAAALQAAVASHAASPSSSRAAGALSSTTAAPPAAPSTYTATAQGPSSGPATGSVGEHSLGTSNDDIPVETEAEIEERCKAIMKKDKVVVFMKGHPDAPRCGFSQKTVNILREQKVEFSHYDILEDEGVRQGE